MGLNLPGARPGGGQHGTKKRGAGLALTLSLAASGCPCGANRWLEGVRQPVFAGSYYPRDAKELDAALTRLLDRAPPPIEGPVQAIVAPHAALIFSGAQTAAAFKAASANSYDRVVVIGDVNTGRFAGLALPDVQAFGSPLGGVHVDREAVDLLSAAPGFRKHAAAFDDEYEIENLVPWIRKVFPNATLVPIVVGDVPKTQRDAVVQSLRAVLEGKTLFVLSTVFSFVGPAAGYTPAWWDSKKAVAMSDWAKNFDAQTMAMLLSRRRQELLDRASGPLIMACAPHALDLFTSALAPGEGSIISYATSVTSEAEHRDGGPPAFLDSIVGYGAVVFRGASR